MYIKKPTIDNVLKVIKLLEQNQTLEAYIILKNEFSHLLPKVHELNPDIKKLDDLLEADKKNKNV